MLRGGGGGCGGRVFKRERKKNIGVPEPTTFQCTGWCSNHWATQASAWGAFLRLWEAVGLRATWCPLSHHSGMPVYPTKKVPSVHVGLLAGSWFWCLWKFPSWAVILAASPCTQGNRRPAAAFKTHNSNPKEIACFTLAVLHLQRGEAFKHLLKE